VPLRAVALLAEVELADELDERVRRRLGERSRSRMRRAVERHGAAVVELPPAAILALWTTDIEKDAQRSVTAAAALLEALLPLGGRAVARGAVEVVSAVDAGGLMGAGLAALAELHAEAPDGEIAIGDLLDDELPKPAEVSPPAARTIDAQGEREPGVSAPPPADLPVSGDELIATLFNARAWDALRETFADGWIQLDRRAARSEHGWRAEDLVASLRAIAVEAPDAVAVVQRRFADGGVALGVLRISGHRAGRPFETARALLTVVGDAGISVTEVFAIGDRADARARFDFLRGAAPGTTLAEPAVGRAAPPSAPPTDPWDRHAAQLREWCARFDAHDVDDLVDRWTTDDFVQVDHRPVAGAGERDREAFRAATASSLEMLPDLRAEAVLLAVDGDRRVARIVYVSDAVTMTTFALGQLAGDRLGRQDVYAEATEALEAMGAATGRARTPVQ